MKTFLLFGLFPDDEIEEVYRNSKGSVQNAANQLQWKIVHALDCIPQCDFTIVNAMYVSSFPKGYKKLFLHTKPFSHKPGSHDVNIGFFNPYLFASFFKYLSLKRYFRQILRSTDERVTVVIYALTLPFVRTCKYLKKLNPKIDICAIVPDLPQYMDTREKRNPFRDLLRDYVVKSTNRNVRYIDKFILLTEKMKDVLKTDNYIVMEGIASAVKPYHPLNRGRKTVLYAGTLNRKYGIVDLLEAYSFVCNITDEIDLEIYGYGDAADIVQQYCKENYRIHYHGNIPHNELQERLAEASVLINPRKNNEKFTKYSFPSKTLEYMSFGIPLVAYKLDGIPVEYEKFIFAPSDNSAEALAKEIIRAAVLSEADREAYYTRTTAFINEFKVAEKQGNRIYDFIFEGKQNDLKV